MPGPALNIVKKHSVDFTFSANPKTKPDFGGKRQWAKAKQKAETKQEVWTINLDVDKNSESFNSTSNLSEEESLGDKGSDSSSGSYTSQRDPHGKKFCKSGLKDSFLEI